MPNIDQYKNRLSQAAENMKNSADLGADEFAEVKSLVKEVIGGGAELRDALKDELQQLEDIAKAESKENPDGQSAELVTVISTTRAQFENLKDQVTNTNKQPEKKPSTLASVVSQLKTTYDNLSNMLAFSLGSFLMSAKEKGSFFSSLAPLAEFVGGDRLRLASELSAQGFTAIDGSEGNLSQLLALHRSTYSGLKKEVFFAKVAKKAREKYPDASVKALSYKELTNIAATVEVPKPQQDKVEESHEDDKKDEPKKSSNDNDEDKTSNKTT